MEEFERILQQTMSDYRVSRGERRVLERTLDEMDLDDRQLALLRSRAFDVARCELLSPEAHGVLDWLEDVNKVLARSQEDRAGAKERQRAEAFFSPRDNVPHRLSKMIDQSARCIDVCVFTITDDRISDALLRGFDRNVQLRIITDNDKSADLGSDVQRLERAGVAVRVDRTDSHMHHKFAIFDRRQLLTGSYNWTRSAARENQENVVITDDDNLTRRFQQEFDQLWEQLG